MAQTHRATGQTGQTIQIEVDYLLRLKMIHAVLVPTKDGWKSQPFRIEYHHDSQYRGDGHASDCATHSEPAYPNQPCNCQTR